MKIGRDGFHNINVECVFKPFRNESETEYSKQFLSYMMNWLGKLGRRGQDCVIKIFNSIHINLDFTRLILGSFLIKKIVFIIILGNKN